MSDLARTKRLWERWSSGEGIPDDKDFEFLAKQYALFTELHKIFDPRPNLYSTLDRLEQGVAARKRR